MHASRWPATEGRPRRVVSSPEYCCARVRSRRKPAVELPGHRNGTPASQKDPLSNQGQAISAVDTRSPSGPTGAMPSPSGAPRAGAPARLASADGAVRRSRDLRGPDREVSPRGQDGDQS